MCGRSKGRHRGTRPRVGCWVMERLHHSGDAMTSKPPPVPPANRSDKGRPSSGTEEADLVETGQRPVPDNLEQQDRQGDIKQNTTHQGYQQDR